MKTRQILTVALISTLVSSLFLPTSNASGALDQKPAALPPVVVVTGTTSGAAFGGGGGVDFETACPTNYVATGISASNFVAATTWYNAGLAITCTQVGLTSTGELKLETSSVKKAAFVWAPYTANRDSLCTTGYAISTVRVYANNTGFVQNVGANCKSLFTQAASEEIDAANSPQWFSPTPSLSSCPAGSFVIGIYGRHGEGIDRLGARCGSFSVDFPKRPVFQSAFPMDLIPTSPSSFIRIGSFANCTIGSFGYRFLGMANKDAQKVELDSITFILKVDGKIVGSASSDNFKNLPKSLLGIDDNVVVATYEKGSVTWNIPAIATGSSVSCQVFAFKESQMTVVTLSE